MKAKIYVIRSISTPDIYYGCTHNKYLCNRLAQHKARYKENTRYMTSFEILKHGNAYIELIEEFEYTTYEEKVNKEAYYILNNPCVNKNIPNRTSSESKKNWYNNNKHYYKEYRQRKKNMSLTNTNEASRSLSEA